MIKNYWKFFNIILLSSFFIITVNVTSYTKIFDVDFCKNYDRNIPSELTYGLPVKSKNLEKLEKFVQKNSAFFSKFMQHYKNTSIPTLFVSPPLKLKNLTFKDLINAPCANLTGIRKTASQVLLLGDYYYLKGKPYMAAKLYLTVLKFGVDVSHAFGSVKTLLNHIIALTIIKAALKRLAALLASNKLNLKQMETIILKIKNLIKKRSPLLDAIKSERALPEKFCSSNLKEHMFTPLYAKKKSKLLYKLLKYNSKKTIKCLKAISSKVYGELEQALQKGYIKGRNSWRKAENYMKEIENSTSKNSSNIFLTLMSPSDALAKILFSIMTPNFTKAFDKDNEVENYLQGIMLIYFIIKFKKTNGFLPPSLKKLKDKFPEVINYWKDKFTGSLFKYKLKKDSFILYSFGADGKDNHMAPFKDDHIIFNLDFKFE